MLLHDIPIEQGLYESLLIRGRLGPLFFLPSIGGTCEMCKSSHTYGGSGHTCARNAFGVSDVTDVYYCECYSCWNEPLIDYHYFPAHGQRNVDNTAVCLYCEEGIHPKRSELNGLS